MQLPLTRSRSRRQGQALILAVLVMLFAVLLSSAFLVVIGNSGRQVGRETERSEASRNADKGVDFVVARLRASSTPDSWYPAGDNTIVPGGVIPAPGNTDYDIYYSQLDKAMGWARGATTLDRDSYAKYPDPRSSRQAPQFLVSSHLIGTNAADDAEGGDKRFMLRITVIGLSSKNPDLWSRRTLYKSTNWNGGTFSYANFVTSFDPKTRKPIVSALMDAPVASTTTGYIDVKVYTSKGQGNEQVTYSPQIAEVGNTLMLSNGQVEPLVGIVSNSTTIANGYQLTLRVLKGLAGATNFGANSKIALVGSLFESPSNIDEDGNGAGVPAANEGPTDTQPVVSVSADTTPYTSPFGNGAQFNNGVNVPLTTIYAARPAVQPTAGSPTVAGQNTFTSTGPISVGDISTTTTQVFGLINTKALPTPTPFSTPIPSQNQFVRVGFDASGALRSDTASSPVAPVVAPRAVTPALIDFPTYRAKVITAYGSFTNQTTFTASGLYIPNGDDVEKFNGVPLTTNQLQRLWQRKSFPVTAGGNIVYSGASGPIAGVAVSTSSTAARLCYGRPGIDSYTYPMGSGGLEARGIRGWISPWEFLPRGPRIIFNGNTITFIRDPLSDASANAPDTNKAVTGRQFTQTLTAPIVAMGATPQPINICVEGNARVSGTWSNAAPVSIVSGNNIYVEGSVKAPVGKIALLAKKNVVLNPTQFVSRSAGSVDTSVGADAVVGTGTANSAVVTVDVTKFKINDAVSVFSQTGGDFDGWRTVTDIGTTTITLDKALPNLPAYTGTVKVKLVCDPPIVLAQRDLGADVDPKVHFLPTMGDPANKDATISEVPVNSTTLAAANTFWAYAFKKGGDTLTRYVPFTDATGTQYTIGVAARQAAAKKNVTFTVQGGTDPDPMAPQDNGTRQFTTRQNPDPTKPYELFLAPKVADINSQSTYDLRDITGTGSPQGDVSAQNLTALNTAFTAAATITDTSKTRWRIDLTDPKTGDLQGRRLAKVIVPIPSLATPVKDEPGEADYLTSARAPLTSSVLLFGGGLPNTAPATTNVLLRVGSLFGYQATAGDPTLETNFIEAAAYGQNPVWDHPAGSGTPNVVAYNQSLKTDTFSWTRDGSGDYDNQLPTYFLSGWRFQRVSGNQSIPAAVNDPKVNMTVEVDATIYAEGGSWFIIPVPTPDANGAALTDSGQKIEWRRPGYNITINGNITQMMTPTVTYDYDSELDPDSVATGAMQRWTDSLSYQNTDGSNIRWKTISYNAAPLPAIVYNMTTMQYEPANLPQLPSSNDILYTYSN